MVTLFETRRLVFREFTKKDTALIRELNSDPLVTKYVNDSTTTWAPIDVLERIIIPQYRLYNYGRWAVHLKTGGAFIGWCGLKYRPEHLYVDLGYRFLQRHWGLGYATEAAKACIDYGFNVLLLPSVYAMAHVENASSCRVLEKSGMSFIGDAMVDNSPVRRYRIHKYYTGNYPDSNV